MTFVHLYTNVLLEFCSSGSFHIVVLIYQEKKTTNHQTEKEEVLKQRLLKADARVQKKGLSDFKF